MILFVCSLISAYVTGALTMAWILLASRENTELQQVIATEQYKYFEERTSPKGFSTRIKHELPNLRHRHRASAETRF